MAGDNVLIMKEVLERGLAANSRTCALQQPLSFFFSWALGRSQLLECDLKSERYFNIILKSFLHVVMQKLPLLL